jgi:Protein of unknown function (DUF3800)
MKQLPEGYTVYCDESRHDSQKRNPYMAIGGLWVPTNQKKSLTKDLRDLFIAHGIRAEVKWSKTSERYLSAYKAIIDFFIERELHFRVIVIDQSKVDYGKFKGGDEELGFYTFYYEMLIKWLDRPVTYNLLLDFKKNKGLDHYEVLSRCLRAKIPDSTTISGIHVIDSNESPLAQLTDILTGAVAASWCGFPGATPKAHLSSYIAHKTERSSLNLKSTHSTFSKLNIFKIELQ